MTDTLVPDIDFVRVHVYTGKVAHLVDYQAPLLPGVNENRAPSLCNYRPIWPGGWLTPETDMPTCRTCDTLKGNVLNGRPA